MWIYEKKLQFPVKIKNPNPKLAQVIVSQLGGAEFIQQHDRRTFGVDFASGDQHAALFADDLQQLIGICVVQIHVLQLETGDELRRLEAF